MLEPNTPPRLTRRRRSPQRDLKPLPSDPSISRANPRVRRQGEAIHPTERDRRGWRSLFTDKRSRPAVSPNVEREGQRGAAVSPHEHRTPLVNPSQSRVARIGTRIEPIRPIDRGERTRPLKPQSIPTPTPPTRKARRPRRPPSPILYGVRLIILGVGIGAIAGTLLSAFDPALRQGGMSEAAQSSVIGSHTNNSSRDRRAANGSGIIPVTLQLSEQMAPLAARVQALTAQNPGLTPGVFLVDMDTGAYLDLNGTSIFSAASMIKVPVLVAFFQDVDAGKIRLDEQLTMRPQDIGSGSGEMQYQPPGTRFTALETAFKMIVISDNTATNMLITRMGGAEALNQRFREWGLTNTVIRNPLPDLEGTNTTTPKELVELMARVSQGDLVSLRSRDRMLEIMQRTVTNTLLPAGLDEDATIAHKTGDIGSLVGDVGVIDAPNGKRYVATVMVQRPHNDERAQELIRQISRAAYEYLTQPVETTSATAPTQIVRGEAEGGQ